MTSKESDWTSKRDHYKTPTVQEITHLLAGSKKLTKVNGTSSYLCIVLDYESSLLTTFNTLWGRYRFVCLPWGLSCAQDIFQWMMDQILECCEGVIGIADEVIIHGKDDEDHDRNLHKDSVTFFGTVYDANGAHPDPKKVDAIHKMPPPDNKQQLQHFLGMVTYLSPFIPSLSTHTAPLQELLKKDSEFMWNPTYQEAFNQIKKLVCKDTTLQYFNVWKPVTVQVDATKKGLGAAVLQEGCPVAFAFKALTPTEQ